ncbi:TPA: hypothetical protein KNG82_002187 [Escherichia coli]|nr:hypothetical protein [Escherichia coli]
MNSEKYSVCGFQPVPPEDKFCGLEFIDRYGERHTVNGKRGTWLYITDKDRIFTANQLHEIINFQPVEQTIPARRLLRERVIHQAADRLKARL